MKFIVLGDLHFISDDDPFKDVHRRRQFFQDAWPSFQRLSQLLREQSPDLVISLGDVVDWYSSENRDYALNWLDEMGLPWVMTPGNHDLAGYAPGAPSVLDEGGEKTVRESIAIPAREYHEKAVAGWEAAGVDVSDRVIDAGRYRLLLVNSALSTVTPTTERWLHEITASGGRYMMFTHVPINVPVVANYIHSVEPHRNLDVYTQGGAPHLFRRCLKGRVDTIFSAHLHFAGQLHLDGTDLYLRPLSIVPEGKTYRDQGSAMVVTLEGNKFRTHTLHIPQ